MRNEDEIRAEKRMSWWLLGSARAARTSAMALGVVHGFVLWNTWGTGRAWTHATMVCFLNAWALWMTWTRIPQLRRECVMAIVTVRREIKAGRR